MTTQFTATMRLNKPDFRTAGWSDAVNNNWDTIDTAIANVLLGVHFVPWDNNESFIQGDIAFDTTVNPLSYWVCNVAHMSGATGTFADERATHTTYWTQFVFNYRPRGAWTNDTAYLVNDIAYDSSLGITGIVKLAHTSNHAGTIQDDASNWDFIVFLPDSLPASAISYDNEGSGMPNTNVQGAIDTLDERTDTLESWRSSTADPDLTDLLSRVTALEGLNTANGIDDTTNVVSRLTTTEFDTGDVIITHRATAKTGWLVIADQTIGSPTSGATFADTTAHDLYIFLYGTYSNTICPVTGGRGANAAADWAANKPMQITKTLGRKIICAGVAGSGLTARSAGATGGEETHLNDHTEIPTITGSVSASGSASAGGVPNTGGSISFGAPGPGGAINVPTTNSGGWASAGSLSVSTTGSSSSTNTGSSAHNNMDPYLAMPMHIKL